MSSTPLVWIFSGISHCLYLFQYLLHVKPGNAYFVFFFGVNNVLWSKLRNIPSSQNLMDTSQLGKNQILNHFLSFIFFYIFCQSANINWMITCSVSHVMIIFSLIYYLSIHHGNKYPSSSWKLSINLSQNWFFGDMFIKINNKLKFLSRKNSFLTPALRRLLWNALIQPHFDYYLIYSPMFCLVSKSNKEIKI